MKDYTEEELEVLENDLINTVDSVIRGMTKENKTALLEMLIDSLESMIDE